MSKVFFKVEVSDVLDIITNSSSELFVMKGKTKEIVEEMISEAYPEYLREYASLKTLQELDENELYSYVSYHYSRWSNMDQKEINEVIPGFTFDEMFEKPSWSRSDMVFIRNDFVYKNVDKIKEAIDPDNSMFFLFSLDENPDWEYQEKLSMIGDRYHLG